ncbi:MAG: hypothetical protein LBC21_04645 [Oscillospiraceae bacterium]|jgi:hypothetical protein|nr:hypothetical protein [Oscillospiraceae bacterium]
MAFLPYSADVDKSIPNEDHPAVSGDYRVGQALYFENGVLKTASDTNVARYICVQESRGHEDGAVLAAHRINHDVRYQTTAALAPTVGNSYDVESGGLSLAATSSTGNFAVDQTWDDASGVHWAVGRFTEDASARLADIESRLDAGNL